MFENIKENVSSTSDWNIEILNGPLEMKDSVISHFFLDQSSLKKNSTIPNEV